MAKYYSEAGKRATMKWNKENMDQVSIRVAKGTNAAWKEYAEAAGLSLAGFISAAAEEKAERMGIKKEGAD